MAASKRCCSCLKTPTTFAGDKYCQGCGNLVCNTCIAVGRLQSGQCDSCRRNMTVKCTGCYASNSTVNMRCVKCHAVLPRKQSNTVGSQGSFLPPANHQQQRPLPGGSGGYSQHHQQQGNHLPSVNATGSAAQSNNSTFCNRCPYNKLKVYNCSDCGVGLCNFCTKGSEHLCSDCVQRRVENINNNTATVAGRAGQTQYNHLGTQPQQGSHQSQPRPQQDPRSPTTPQQVPNPNICYACSKEMRTMSYMCRQCKNKVCIVCSGSDYVCKACKIVPLPSGGTGLQSPPPPQGPTHSLAAQRQPAPDLSKQSAFGEPANHSSHSLHNNDNSSFASGASSSNNQAGPPQAGPGGYSSPHQDQQGDQQGDWAPPTHHGAQPHPNLAYPNPPEARNPHYHQPPPPPPPPQSGDPSSPQGQTPPEAGAGGKEGSAPPPYPAPQGQTPPEAGAGGREGSAPPPAQDKTPRHLRYPVPTSPKLVLIPAHGNVTLKNGALIRISLDQQDLHKFGRIHGEVVMIPDGTERRAEIIGTANEDLIWLLEGSKALEVADKNILEFLAEEESERCPRCLWSIPTACVPHHTNICPAPPPTGPDMERFQAMCGAAKNGAGGNQDQESGDDQKNGGEEGKKQEPEDEYAEFVQGDALEPGAYTSIKNVQLLGQGAQGRVFKATAKDPSGRSALIVTKEITYPLKEEKQYLKHAENVREQKSLKHTHLIRYVDVGFESSKMQHTITILMPYYKESDLNNFLRTQKKPLEEYTVCTLVLQIANALKYLHHKNIAHLDIKPDNVLMFDNCQRTLLMDLDTARNMGPASPASGESSGHGHGGRKHGGQGAPLPPSKMQAKTMVGTMEYMAPEVASGHGYEVSCDIWSLGVVLFDLMVLPEFPMLPLDGRDTTLACPDWTMEKLFNATGVAVANNLNRAKAKPYSHTLYHLLCSMLDHDPKKRPRAWELCDKLEELMTKLILGEE